MDRKHVQHAMSFCFSIGFVKDLEPTAALLKKGLLLKNMLGWWGNSETQGVITTEEAHGKKKDRLKSPSPVVK